MNTSIAIAAAFTGTVERVAPLAYAVTRRSYLRFAVSVKEVRAVGDGTVLKPATVEVTFLDESADQLARRLDVGSIVSLEGLLRLEPWYTNDSQQSELRLLATKAEVVGVDHDHP